jgi:hypothetical protein
MSGIPLHVQRRFERRWAAKLAPAVEPKSVGVKGPVNSLPRPAKATEKLAGLSRRAQSGR